MHKVRVVNTPKSNPYYTDDMAYPSCITCLLKSAVGIRIDYKGCFNILPRCGSLKFSSPLILTKQLSKWEFNVSCEEHMW